MSAPRPRLDPVLEHCLELCRFLTWDLGMALTPWQLSCHLGVEESSALEQLEQLRSLGYMAAARQLGKWEITPRGREMALRLARGRELSGARGSGPTGGRRRGSAVCGDRGASIAPSAPGPGESRPASGSTAVRTPEGSPGGRRVSRSPKDWRGMERSASLASRGSVGAIRRSGRRSR